MIEIKRRKIEKTEETQKTKLKLIIGGKRVKKNKEPHQRMAEFCTSLKLKSQKNYTVGNIDITSKWLYYYDKNKKIVTYKITPIQLGELLKILKNSGSRKVEKMFKEKKIYNRSKILIRKKG